MVLAGVWRAQVSVVEGVVEAHGPALAWLLSHFTLVPDGAAALTLGHVVIARDSWSLESTRAHERVHVRQCEVWGPLFVPAYLSASLSATLRGGNCYFDNRFEVEAFDAARNEPGAEGAQLGVASHVTPGAMTRSRSMVHRPVETFVSVEGMAAQVVGSRGPASGLLPRASAGLTPRSGGPARPRACATLPDDQANQR